MGKPPEIHTKRLWLRPVRAEDAQDIFAYARNPNVLRYTTGRTPKALAETEAFVHGLMNKPEGAYAWAICLRGEGRAIGVVEFGVRDGVTGGVDYAMAEEYWNRGIMTEAVSAVLEWAFSTFSGLGAVSSGAMAINKASRRVMEKCGMVLQTQVQEKWDKFEQPVDLVAYGVSRQRWLEPRARASR